MNSQEYGFFCDITVFGNHWQLALKFVRVQAKQNTSAGRISSSGCCSRRQIRFPGKEAGAELSGPFGEGGSLTTPLPGSPAPIWSLPGPLLGPSTSFFPSHTRHSGHAKSLLTAPLSLIKPLPARPPLTSGPSATSGSLCLKCFSHPP